MPGKLYLWFAIVHANVFRKAVQSYGIISETPRAKGNILPLDGFLSAIASQVWQLRGKCVLLPRLNERLYGTR